jgi:hypothetical protein
MLAELVDHVIGIDPDKDWIAAGSWMLRRPASSRLRSESDAAELVSAQTTLKAR